MQRRNRKQEDPTNAWYYRRTGQNLFWYEADNMIVSMQVLVESTGVTKDYNLEVSKCMNSKPYSFGPDPCFMELHCEPSNLETSLTFLKVS